MKLCTRCDTDDSVGVHLVFREAGREVGHLCLPPGKGAVEIDGDSACIVTQEKTTDAVIYEFLGSG